MCCVLGILLSWNFGSLKVPTKVALFQLYAYQESSDSGAASSKLWNKVGEVNALPLPMACTLTQVYISPVFIYTFIGSYNNV
jgi:hypothetical protein